MSEPLLQFFAYRDLPMHLHAIANDFKDMATLLVETLPRNAERTVALRKLLESRDCALRALMYVEGAQL